MKIELNFNSQISNASQEEQSGVELRHRFRRTTSREREPVQQTSDKNSETRSYRL